MAYKRLIFSLLYFQGNFVLSRNFNRQKVGNWQWLLNKYHLLEALTSLDELVILNIDQSENGFDEVLSISKELATIANLPISVGGGIRNLEMAARAFESGADKLVLNSLFFESSDELDKIVSRYGEQAVVFNIDYRTINGERVAFSNCGMNNEGALEEILNKLSEYRFGELLLRNIDRDGTGFGNDLELFQSVRNINKPILVAGGTGKSQHVVDAFNTGYIDGVVTANILNFIGSGLVQLRAEVSKNNELATWS
jgi:imidazole glycerol-phosphate synthase subunit HisF